MAVNSFMVPLGTPAPPFALPSLNGQTVASDDLPHGQQLLVMFLSNHCPYVRHIERELGSLVSEYARDVVAVAICSNDTETYPADGPDGQGKRERAKNDQLALRLPCHLPASR